MNGKAIASFRRLAPPVIFDAVKWRFGTRFTGRYASWAAAQNDCEGYDSDAILNRILESTRAVVGGRAAGERDGIALERVEYSWPVLAGLLWVASQRESSLRVLDFGGSLGSSYRQNLRFLSALRELQWAVVEQPSFVSAGKREFEDGTLRFFDDVQTAFDAIRPNVVFLSSVLQYLETPYDMLDRILALETPFILLDRTPLIEGERDRLTVQTVSKRVYPGSYPAWFFSRTGFMRRFEDGYELIEIFESADRANVRSQYTGALFKRK